MTISKSNNDIYDPYNKGQPIFSIWSYEDGYSKMSDEESKERHGDNWFMMVLDDNTTALTTSCRKICTYKWIDSTTLKSVKIHELNLRISNCKEFIKFAEMLDTSDSVEMIMRSKEGLNAYQRELDNMVN